MTVQGMMQQEQSSPHQQGSLTPGVVRLIPFWTVVEEVDVAEVAEEDVLIVEAGILNGVVLGRLGEEVWEIKS